MDKADEEVLGARFWLVPQSIFGFLEEMEGAINEMSVYYVEFIEGKRRMKPGEDPDCDRGLTEAVMES